MGDLCAAARAILAVPVGARTAAMDRMLAQAQAADAYRKRFGRAHPRWGNGSLMGAAFQVPLPPEPFLSDLAYLDCLSEALAALRRRPGPRRN